MTDDFGDALLKAGKVSKEKYEFLQDEAKHILSIHARRKIKNE